MPNKKNLLKAMGPGILFASTAIGVSHLVQSTKAGAGFGFGLLWAILLANLFKYPFFEYGSRYANATGKSIIDGYHQLGRWALWFYFIITIASMFFVCAAVMLIRNLEVPFGTVGGRIAGTKIFFSYSALLNCTVSFAPPTTKG